MPVTSSAKKALKQEKRRAKENKRTRRQYKEAIKSFLKKPGEKTLSLAYSLIDRAAKKNVIHANKAKRLKSKLAKIKRKKATPRKTNQKSSSK